MLAQSLHPQADPDPRGKTTSMVRRGSTVRVRQRASAKVLQTLAFHYLVRCTCSMVIGPSTRRRAEQHGKFVDLSAFQRDILPLIQAVPLSRLQRATGLSLRYVSLIRGGERTPHSRHWQAFIEASALRDLDSRRT